MFWKDLTSPELGKIKRSIPVVLPLAAIEQHGPHLTVETDTLIASGLCEATDRLIKDKVLFLPTLTYGCSAHHQCFPGTLSLSHETWLRIVEDIVASVFHEGFETVVLFNSHGGNQAIGQVALEKLGERNPNKKVAMLTWWKIVPEKLRELNSSGTGGVGHACEFETSLILNLSTKSVRMNKIPQRGNRSTHSWAEGDMLRGTEVAFHRNMRAMTLDGTYGEPCAATPGTGHKLITCVTQRFAEILRDLSPK